MLLFAFDNVMCIRSEYKISPGPSSGVVSLNTAVASGLAFTRAICSSGKVAAFIGTRPPLPSPPRPRNKEFTACLRLDTTLEQFPFPMKLYS